MFFAILVDSVYTDSVNQKPQCKVPPSLNTFKPDVNVFHFYFQVVNNPEDVLLHNGIRVPLFLFEFHLDHVSGLVNHFLKPRFDIELVLRKFIVDIKERINAVNFDCGRLFFQVSPRNVNIDGLNPAKAQPEGQGEVIKEFPFERNVLDLYPTLEQSYIHTITYAIDVIP